MVATRVSIADVIDSFEELTKVFKAELLSEYKATRITGDKYAEVYTALMSQAMQQSVGFIIQAQQGDANAELTAQRIISEKAQVQDHIQELIDPNGENGIVKGSIGKQKAVYDAQIKGFKDDALQKGTKLMTDVWSLQRSTDTGISPNAENKLYDGNIGSAIETYFNQLGIAQAQPPQVAWIQMNSSDGTSVVSASGNVTLLGNLGDNGASVASIVISSSAGGNPVSVAPPTIGEGIKTFTVSSVSVSSLPAGTLTCTTRIRATSGEDIVVTDTVEKTA